VPNRTRAADGVVSPHATWVFCSALSRGPSQTLGLLQRNVSDIGLDVASDIWNFAMTMSPGLAQAGDRDFRFYNGRSYGEDGFGMAELLEW
jgi:hypothetical protein